MIITIKEHCGSFAENKDVAKKLRETLILPSFKSKEKTITIDFSDIDSSTQSFIHALLSDVFRKHGETALKRMQFKGCNKPIKSLVGTVINYSLE